MVTKWACSKRAKSSGGANGQPGQTFYIHGLRGSHWSAVLHYRINLRESGKEGKEMKTETVYVIEKNGCLLNQLFVDDINEMFTAKGKGKGGNVYDVSQIYFYNTRQIAMDVAEKLDALWVQAVRTGTRIETL